MLGCFNDNIGALPLWHVDYVLDNIGTYYNLLGDNGMLVLELDMDWTLQRNI